MAVLALFLVLSPAFPDPFNFLPAKEAQRAREALAALDASISVWSAAFERFSEAEGKSRTAVGTLEDSAAYKALLESGVTGAWKTGKEPPLSAYTASVRKNAERLEALLTPRVDKAGAEALHGLLETLSSRLARFPGCAAECGDFMTRTGAVSLEGLRFSVKSALGVFPEEVALRVLPDDKDPTALPYGKDANLAALAESMRNLRKAAEAVRAAAGILAVPELPWAPEETVKAEEAARLLSGLRTSARARALECAAIPGVDLLPAFLSGLSPEELARWKGERGLSSRAVRVFLASAGGLGEPPEVDESAGQLALAKSLAELEREASGGIKGIDLLSRLTDPALRSVLDREAAAPGLRSARDEAVKELTRTLEASLSETSAVSGSGESAVSETSVRVESERIEVAGGLVAIRAYSVSKEGERKQVPAENLASALETVLNSSIGNSAARGIPSSVRLGIIASESLDERAGPSLYAEWMREADPASFAVLSGLASRRLEEAALSAGISLEALRPRELERLSAVSLLRCLGRARDEDVAEAVTAVGGYDRAAELWETAFRKLDAARRALAAYAGEAAGS